MGSRKYPAQTQGATSTVQVANHSSFTEAKPSVPLCGEIEAQADSQIKKSLGSVPGHLDFVLEAAGYPKGREADRLSL